MPGLDFAPEFERHTTIAACYECPRKWEWLSKVRAGSLPPSPPTRALAIGIGMDAGLTALWANGFDRENDACDAAFLTLQAELAPTQALESLKKLAGQPSTLDVNEIYRVVDRGIRQYAAQWDAVRAWTVIALHPYQSETWRQLWASLYPQPYLPMPDGIFRIGERLTVVDFKTGKYPYDPGDWLTNPQMIVNAAAVKRIYNEPVDYLIDYCQRPAEKQMRGGTYAALTWTFPAAMAMVLDEHKERLAWQWVENGFSMLQAYKGSGNFPRSLGACRGKYGLCEFYWQGCVMEGVTNAPHQD